MRQNYFAHMAFVLHTLGMGTEQNQQRIQVAVGITVEDRDRIERIAERTGKSRKRIVHEALDLYEDWLSKLPELSPGQSAAA